MKPLLLMIALLFFAGCASTPHDTLTTEPYRISGKLPPAQYARCLINNAEKASGDFSGREDQPEQPDWRRVQIRHSSAGAAFIADIAPQGSGSDVTLWVSRNMIFGGALVDVITKSC
jgi:hypothetical protein